MRFFLHRLNAPFPRTVFSSAALLRAEDRREDIPWLRRAWRGGEVLVIDADGRALADGAGQLRALAAASLPEAAFAAAILLGVDDAGDAGPGRAWFALESDAVALPDDASFVDLRRAGLAWGEQAASLFAQARALVLWRRRARHCGSCGAPTLPARAGYSVRCSASGCAIEQFPRLDPAVIVLVTDGTRCLLGRQPGWPTGQYSTLAGFVEPGESLEDALRREVAEEAGVTLGACRYRGSQPWPFPASLMVGFRADAVDPTIHLGDELEDARWFEVDALLEEIGAGRLRASSPVSIAFRLLHEWVAELRGADAAERLAGPR